MVVGKYRRTPLLLLAVPLPQLEPRISRQLFVVQLINEGEMAELGRTRVRQREHAFQGLNL
jgi:hypothetical protein